MRITDYEVDGVHCHAEYFRSTAEALEKILSSRTSSYSKRDIHDFIDNPKGASMHLGGDPEHYGVGSVDELKTLIRNGSNDIADIKRVRAFAQKSATQALSDKKVRVSDITGENIDVAAYLAGIPECMDDHVRIPKEHKVVKLILDTGVHYGITGRDLTRAGKHLCKLVVSLEKAGYRVRVVGAFGFCTGNSTDIMAVDVKSEKDTINYRRMMFMLSPAFFRGFGFGWFVRSATVDRGDGLGCPLPNAYSFCKEEEMLQKAINDKNAKLIRISSIIDRLDQPDEKIAQYLVDTCVEM